MSSIVHSITLMVLGVESKVVLRQFDNADWLKQEPDLALHEAESLRWAAKTGVPTPEFSRLTKLAVIAAYLPY